MLIDGVIVVGDVVIVGGDGDAVIDDVVTLVIVVVVVVVGDMHIANRSSSAFGAAGFCKTTSPKFAVKPNKNKRLINEYLNKTIFSLTETPHGKENCVV